MRKAIVIFFSILFFSFSASSKDVSVFFSPTAICENKIVKLINDSELAIDAAIYAINNDEIVKALKKANNRGVKIRILTDRLQAAGKNSKVRELYDCGINIRVHSKFKIEHNKFAIFDKKIASSGSYNWTNPASDKNRENCIFFIKNKEVVKKYIDRFEYLWKINTKRKSDEWFERRKTAA